jgi:chemosensory pili system protein ChpA (sensor histidine kinase/response regulator)
VHSENNDKALNTVATQPSKDEQLDESLDWLIDQSYSEPEEKLFALDDDGALEFGLSATEMEMAARPMSSSGVYDDLAGFVEEEIVMSSVGESSDIYQPDATTAVQFEKRATVCGSVVVNPNFQIPQSEELAGSNECVDIFDLSEDDDIGEKPLVLQRVKPQLEVAPLVANQAQQVVDNTAQAVTLSRALDISQQASMLSAVSEEEKEESLDPVDRSGAVMDEILAQEEVFEPSVPVSVFDYVSNNDLPTDDADFDQYLLAGEHLFDPEEDLPELSVQRTEGVPVVDPDLSCDIDYHADFAVSSENSSQTVVAITEVIADIMEQFSGMCKARLASLNIESAELNLEFMLACSEEERGECVQNGYLSITAITSNLPAAVSSLGQTDIDAIHVRIENGSQAEEWNLIFTEDFALQQPILDPLTLDDLESEVFLSEDGLCAPFAETEELWDNFSFLGDDLSSDSTGLDATLEDAWDGLEPSTEKASLPAEVQMLTEIFDEDVFADDFMAELVCTEPGNTADVDELLNSFGGHGIDFGEVCGIAVDAFPAESEVSNEQAIVAAKSVDINIVEPEGLSGKHENSEWFLPVGIRFDYTGQSPSELFKDFLDAFLEEGALELEKLEDAMGEWENDVNSAAAFAPIPRVLHNLKGIAKGVGLQRYGTLVHNFETLLDKMPRPEAQETEAYFRIVNAWLDAAARGFEKIEEIREDIASEIPQPSIAPVGDIQTTKASQTPDRQRAVQSVAKPAAAQPTMKVRELKLNDKTIADEGAKTLAAQQTIRMTPEAVDHLMNLTNQAQQLGVRSSQGTVKGKLATAELQGRLTSIRTHIAKIADRSLLNVTASAGRGIDRMDALEMDQYSELQEAANILSEGVEDLGDLIQMCSRQSVIVESLLKQQASVVSSLRSAIQGCRVIPVSRLMPGVRRIVRTVGAELGKAVNFRVLNEVGSLDRDNFNRCQIILEHMVRNALDHGVEAPDERVVAGKPMTGRISVDVSKQGNEYVITLADDGRGIDPDVMRETAFEKGLDLDIAALTDQEAQRLIFHKGFSTATELSEISGRGVGMDIVFSELQQIGGDIEIVSEVGQGTTFKIKIPSNITVNGALLVNAGGASYAVPLDGLIAVEHVATEDFFQAVESDTTLEIFGMDCQPTYLGALCGGSSLPLRENWGESVPVIIAGGDDRYMAIAIDDLQQALELVIRSLGNQFSTVPGVAGGATTSDGEAVVALDLNALVHSLESSGLSLAFVTAAEQNLEQIKVLVVDDSRTQRMVATSQFDALGVETVTAENGLVAIDLLNTSHKLPDVILLDIEMPVKDGIQTLREIRKSPKLQHLPVIMVTSRTGAKHRRLAEDAGCNGYMGKPFNFPLLVQDISRITGRQLELS